MLFVNCKTCNSRITNVFGQTITKSEYDNLAKEYATVIIPRTKQDSTLSTLHGELGEDDIYLCGLIEKMDSFYVYSIIEQYDESLDNYTYYYLKFSKSIPMYVYSNVNTPPTTLYNSPDTNTVKQVIEDIIVEKLRVIDTNGQWLKVSFMYNNTHYSGWLPYRSYCSNPYSTCN